jgi:phosphoribosyl-ATP pyrophosphohydrolase
LTKTCEALLEQFDDDVGGYTIEVLTDNGNKTYPAKVTEEAAEAIEAAYAVLYAEDGISLDYNNTDND